MGLKSFLERNAKQYDFLDDFLRYVAEVVCLFDESKDDSVVTERMQAMSYVDPAYSSRNQCAARNLVELVKHYIPDEYMSRAKVRTNFILNRDAFRR